MRKSWALLVLVVLGGCDLYFGGDDGDDDCQYGYGAGLAPAQELRNPYNGQCQPYGNYYPCDGTCGPCPEYAGTDIANPDWGQCYSSCDGLQESACLAQAGCFAAYTDDPAADGKKDFYGCWQTAPSGPVHGSCTNLDAQTCSEHDDCSATYSYDINKILTFESCGPERTTSTCDLIDCGSGYHCEQQCYGGAGSGSGGTMDVCEATCVQDITCASVDCGPGYTCAEVCETGPSGTTCHPSCVASAACESLTDESTCKNRSDCTPVYDGQNCTCTINGCSCQVLTYERCETL